MRLIDEFAKRVLNENGSFNIRMKKDNKEGVKTYHFLQSTVGKGRYVYGDCGYWDDRCYSKMDLKPKLVAIVADKIIYVVDEFFFEIYESWHKEPIQLPTNTRKFALIVNEKNEYLKNIAFPKFYDSLETVETKGNGIISCEQKAREVIFSENPIVECTPFDNLFSERDVAEILCGLTNMENEIKEHFEKEREKWVNVKSFNKKVKELIKTNAGVEDWELAIAEGLRSVDAKTVTVEFEFNGKRASAKIKPYEIRRCMLNDHYFSGYEFATYKSGDELIQYLGADTWRGNGKHVLTCKHICRITYGKKELYVRKGEIEQ